MEWPSNKRLLLQKKSYLSSFNYISRKNEIKDNYCWKANMVCISILTSFLQIILAILKFKLCTMIWYLRIVKITFFKYQNIRLLRVLIKCKLLQTILHLKLCDLLIDNRRISLGFVLALSIAPDHFNTSLSCLFQHNIFM